MLNSWKKRPCTSASSAAPPAARPRPSDAADQRLLTLHLLLQTLHGKRLTVERLDGSAIEGTLASADEEMKCATRRLFFRPASGRLLTPSCRGLVPPQPGAAGHCQLERQRRLAGTLLARPCCRK